MKKFDYTFTLTEEDYLQYLRYVVASSKDSKRKGWWLRLSVPVVAIFTLYFFHLYTVWYAVAIAAVIAILWLLVISDKIYQSFLYRKVNNNFLRNLKIQKFEPVHVSFFEDQIIVDKKSIKYVELMNSLPLKDIVVFFHNQTAAFLIPIRTIGTIDDVSALIGYIDLMKEKQQNELANEQENISIDNEKKKK